MVGRIKRSSSENPRKATEIKAKSILGSLVVNGEQMFFVELEDGAQPVLFTDRLANQEFPHLVISYYDSIAEMPK